MLDPRVLASELQSKSMDLVDRVDKINRSLLDNNTMAATVYYDEYVQIRKMIAEIEVSLARCLSV